MTASESNCFWVVVAGWKSGGGKERRKEEWRSASRQCRHGRKRRERQMGTEVWRCGRGFGADLVSALGRVHVNLF